MTGLEKMVASLIGLSPDQMQSMVSDATGLLKTTADRLASIEAKLDALVAAKGTDNDK